MKRNLTKVILFFGIIFFCVILDQVSKALLTNKSFDILGSLLRVDYTKNTGAAFSMLSGARVFFIIITLIFVCVLIAMFLLTKQKHISFVWGASLVSGGAIGNLIDRIAFGFVKDFISISFFPAVFNLADLFITIGTIFLIVYILFYFKKEEKSGN